jgi:Photosynthetic reaction centre cytochrome C subunit
MRSIRAFVIPTVALALASGSAAAQGGPPQQQPPKNLQVLPKDLTRGQVVAIMRGVAIGLGVRCEHCHVQNEAAAGGGAGGGGLNNMDFASDDKETKKTARAMFRMVMDINGKYMVDAGRNLDELTRVSCVTCHHGLAKPRTLAAELVGAVQASGVDSAIARYRELREKYYGSAAFDFSELSLVLVADDLARTPARRPDALKLLALNLEFYPKSGATYASTGQLLMQAGDSTGAMNAVTKGTEVDPDNPQLKQLLTRMRGGGRRP